MKMIDDRTIVAIATASGVESAIGIIRISGEEALAIARSVFVSKSGKQLSKDSARSLLYGYIKDEDRVYDEVLAVYFNAPYTYTTEDVVEFQCHGNINILNDIVNLLIKKGCMPAESGEFTKRAFLGGRLDLSQAEAVMDMVSAKTTEGFDIALKQLGGSVGRKINSLLDVFTDMLAKIEVTIDYPDEDIEEVETNSIREELESVLVDIDEMIASFDSGKIYKDGLSMAIIGSPNVGKSSFMNLLLGEDRAIVTNVPGTTRDIIKEWVDISGIPVNLIDTAGIRNTDDIVEKIGVEKSKEIFNSSDFVVVVVSASESLTSEEKDFIALTKGKKSIVVLNKIDLEKKTKTEDILSINPKVLIVECSMKEEVGIEDFKTAFKNEVISKAVIKKDSEKITNSRHLAALMRAKESIQEAVSSMENGVELDLVQIDLLNAYSFLGEITGKTVDEDVVNRIFEKFCLGK